MSMQDYRIEELYDLTKTIAAPLFARAQYPWELLPLIGDYIVELGNTLPEDKFEKRGENIWIAKSAHVFDSAYIAGPCIIDEDAEIRQCAFIRGKAIVGKGAVVGNSTELKNVILFDKVQVPHYNYVGDSILGFKAHMGAGSITSNGCNSVLNPGTVIGRHTNVYPLSMVRGCVPANRIYKDRDHVVEKMDSFGLTS